MAGAWGREDVREALEALHEFLAGIREPLERLVETVLRAVEGGRVGADVAGFYRSMVEAGVPEELAGDLTREYLARRMAMADPAGLLERIPISPRGRG